jgi:hypothetical protein
LLNSLIAMAITSTGLIILLMFIKPTEKDIKAFDDLEKAKIEFTDAIAQSLKLDKFLDWLNRKMKW